MNCCKRFLIGLILALVSQTSFALNFQDMWTDPSRAGSSIFLAQSGNTMFVGWAGYDAATNPSWVYMVGSLSGVTANLTVYTVSGQFGGPQSSVISIPAGTATITFTSDATATMAYAYSGKSGTLSLQRFTVAPISVSGTYVYSAKLIQSGCRSPSNNGTFYQYGTAVVAAANGTLTMRATNNVTGAYCNYSGAYSQYGAKTYLTGTVACSDGIAGNTQFALSIVDDTFQGAEFTQFVVGETCQASNSFGGTRR